MLKAKPFKPFKVYVADGTAYDVLDSADAAMTLVPLLVGIDPDESGLFRNAVYISPNQVPRIAPLLEAKAS